MLKRADIIGDYFMRLKSTKSPSASS